MNDIQFSTAIAFAKSCKYFVFDFNVIVAAKIILKQNIQMKTQIRFTTFGCWFICYFFCIALRFIYCRLYVSHGDVTIPILVVQNRKCFEWLRRKFWPVTQSILHCKRQNIFSDIVACIEILLWNKIHSQRSRTKKSQRKREKQRKIYSHIK